jgi:hypothetical protein
MFSTRLVLYQKDIKSYPASREKQNNGSKMGITANEAEIHVLLVNNSV